MSKCKKMTKKNEERERERLPPGMSPVDGEERGRGEVVGIRESVERERKFGANGAKSKRRRRKKKRSHCCCWT